MAEEETLASEVIAASLGGAISAGILYPLEVLKTKMQADNNNADKQQQSMLTYALSLYQTQGVSVFVRGVETSSFQSALEKALYFFAYTLLKQGHAVLTNSTKLDGLTNLGLGYAADWAHLPISLPVDAWTTQIQTSSEKPLVVLLTMLSDKNTNFYRGLSAYYLLCLKPALQYTIYEQAKQVVLSNKPKGAAAALTSAEAFLLGMLARTIATVAVFPFLRAKVLMQTSSANNSTLGILSAQWQTAGLAGWYQGIGPELTRGIFSAALMLMIKERIAVVVRQALLRPKQQH